MLRRILLVVENKEVSWYSQHRRPRCEKKGHDDEDAFCKCSSRKGVRHRQDTDADLENHCSQSLTPYGGHCHRSKEWTVDLRKEAHSAPLMTDDIWLVVANGSWPNSEAMKGVVKKSSRLILCDGALNRWTADMITPDLVIGDFDSVNSSSLSFWESKGTEMLRVEDQTTNDLHKALRHLESLGVASCLILGATGGDPAHEWANLLTCSMTPIEVRCQSRTHEYLFFKPSANYSIDSFAGQEFSLFALETSTQIVLEGARFHLRGDDLESGSRGLHNQTTGTEIRIAYQSGRLMMIRALREEALEVNENEA